MANAEKITIIAPLTGEIVALEKVPDPVFAEKIVGDGIAILPDNGKIYSPINGTLVSVAATKHAFGFQSDDGLEMLIHFGLETVGLNGEGFTVHKNEGERVKVGDLIAEVDVDFIKSKNLPTITPVLICAGLEDKTMETASGKVEAGKDAVLFVTENAGAPATSAPAPAAPEPTPAEAPPKKKKALIDFDFLQKLGKVLMTVIAVMPAAGLMLSLGKLVQMVGGDTGAIYLIGSTMENIGWAIINNLHILFAAAIGGSWAKERAGGAFAAVISFILINRITGAAFGVTEAMLSDASAVVHSILGQEMLVENYFTSVLGAPALNMGVFVGIIAGFVGGVVYNKFYNFRKLPDALAFFNGKRFVPLAVIAYSTVISVIMVIIWPIVQSGINAFGIWIANSSSTSNAGSEVFGQDPLWLAWVTDLINFKDAGDMAAYTNLMETVTPARFKVGQMIGATGLLMGIALAMYRRVDSDKKHDYRSMFFSTVLAVFLTGVTEPLEFMFMFCALPLYVVYAILQGCAFAMAGIFDLRVHSFGNLEFLTRVPMSLKAGLSGDIINFIICCVAFLIIGYVVAYFMIGKFQFATPGRLGNYENEGGEEETTAGGENKGGGNSQPERIIALLGGRENIVLVDACMTRLRVTVKDPSKVADTPAWKAEGAKGLVKKDTGIQAIYGPKADVLKSDINDIL